MKLKKHLLAFSALMLTAFGGLASTELVSCPASLNFSINDLSHPLYSDENILLLSSDLTPSPFRELGFSEIVVASGQSASQLTGKYLPLPMASVGTHQNAQGNMTGIACLYIQASGIEPGQVGGMAIIMKEISSDDSTKVSPLHSSYWTTYDSEDSYGNPVTATVCDAYNTFQDPEHPNADQFNGERCKFYWDN